MSRIGLTGWKRRGRIWQIADALVAGTVALNLLWPTSAPLHANGIPLNKSVEYLLASVFLGWLGLLLAFAVLRRLDPGAVSPQRFRWVDQSLTVTALVLGVLLLLVRVSAPPEESITACYSTPELPSISCLFFADGWAPTAAGRVSDVSRLEEQLVFDASQGHGWRLGAFNDLAFNVYDPQPNDQRSAQSKQFRQNKAHPFSVTFAWDAATGDRLARLYPGRVRLWITYRGEVSLITETRTQRLPFSREERTESITETRTKRLPFSREERTESITIRPDEIRSLRLRYANFTCPDSACQTELTMDPIPFTDAVFRVHLSPAGAPADQGVPLDARLLAQADPRLSPIRLGPLIELALVVVALALLVIWMVRLGLARRPSASLVLAAALLASVLAGLALPVNVWEQFLATSGSPLVYVPVGVVVLLAFLGAIGVLAPVVQRGGSGYALQATWSGTLLLLSSGLLAPLAAAGMVFAGLQFGSVVSAPVIGSLSLVGRSRALDLSFVLMTLPVVVGVAGVLVALLLGHRCAVGRLAPALLVLASAGLLMQLPSLAAEASGGPLATTFPPASPGLITIGWSLPPRDDAVLHGAGYDSLTYASWARDLLRAPRQFVDSTVVLSKPFFMYLRAARYALLGDGELYALALSRAVINWAVAVGGILGLTRLGSWFVSSRQLRFRSRMGLGLLAVLGAAAWLWLSYSVVTLSDFFLRASEGPATTAAIMSFGVLLAASGGNVSLFMVAGALFGLSLLYRTSHFPLALLGIAITWLQAGSCARRLLRVSAAYIVPIAVAVLVIWLHAGAPVLVPPEVNQYISDNMRPPYTPPGSFFQGLVPTVLALQITCSAFLAIAVALVLPDTTSTRLRVVALGLAVIFGALGPLLPQRGVLGYPRSLLGAYFAIAFVPFALLVGCSRLTGTSWQPQRFGNDHQVEAGGNRSINRIRPSSAQETPEESPLPSVRPISLCVSPTGIFRFLLGVVACLTLTNAGIIAVTYASSGILVSPENLVDNRLAQFFYLDAESNLPAWYQGTVLALCGLLLLLIAAAYHRKGHKRNEFYWGLLGVIFLYLSIDELTSLHERTMEPLHAALRISSEFLSFAWVVPAAALLVILVIILIPFLLSLPSMVRSQFLIAGMVFVTGALGFEMLGSYSAINYGWSSMAYLLVSTLEELLEMLGVVLFLRALLLYIGNIIGSINILSIED